MATSLVSRFTKEGDLVYDPLSGSGTVALDAWLAGRRVVANDLSPYAGLLTRAKLFPYRSLEDALRDIEHANAEATALRGDLDLRKVPGWLRQFFHPETLVAQEHPPSFQNRHLRPEPTASGRSLKGF